ncbi:hypothetical protein [Hymenobacter sp. CRA2]|uniref:hypothetical protein n=1 Tax=Hymenobacter sp. CRA2 TaxID=1955620 RepID=UPI00098F4F20|nr:hypothetical protein [Hymenobacter sp. CRA2]OON69068.1 hypothetical protein B0919_10180 [Hymenobacter sp. CRA2]
MTQPPTSAPGKRPLRRDPVQEMMAQYAPGARRLNAVLLAFCLLLGLDWALPPREYANEPVLSRQIVLTSSSASDPRMAYDIATPHARFRLASEQGARVRDGQRITVWSSPVFGVVRRVSSPASPEGAVPFRPASGIIYGPFAVAPVLLLAVALAGVWPRRRPETYVNTAVAGVLLVLIVGALLVWS